MGSVILILILILILMTLPLDHLGQPLATCLILLVRSSGRAAAPGLKPLRLPRAPINVSVNSCNIDTLLGEVLPHQLSGFEICVVYRTIQ